MWAPFAITPEVDCREYPCPLWLRGVAFLLGALFGCGALLAIVRGMVWGGRLDSTTGEILWWHGAPGDREHRIPVAQISRIIVTHGDSVSLSLRDTEGRRVVLPAECVPPPIAEWAAEMGRRFPHIEIEIND
ncbi:MAG TPA: hypothetical protein VMY41_01990 [Thermohalobaculum sp.]|nr:hypothetical protein [Thermohalobaculum sp.]